MKIFVKITSYRKIISLFYFFFLQKHQRSPLPSGKYISGHIIDHTTTCHLNGFKNCVNCDNNHIAV